MTYVAARPVKTDEDISDLRAINEEVQLQHFSPMIGEKQVRYMMEKFFTVEMIRKNMEEGEQFYVMSVPDIQNAGYFSYIPKIDENKIKLSRVFVKERARGHGLFHYAFDHIAQVGRQKGLKTMFLTVNKNNSLAIEAYEKKGFAKTDEVKFDIGGGFIMDDFVFEYDL